MNLRRRRHALALVGLPAVMPEQAMAHASGQAVMLTLPTGAFIWGAGAAVTATALLAGLVARGPAFAARTVCRLPSVPVWPSWISAGVHTALIYVGFAGPTDPMENLLTLWIWCALWLGMVILQALAGDLWLNLNPWVGPVRALRAAFGLRGGVGLGRLGQWPAVAGLFAFAWFEIVSLAPADPRQLAWIVTAYYLAILVLATLEGETWLGQGEFLTVFMTNVARIAPLWRMPADDRAGRWAMAGLPGAQILRMAPLSTSALAFVLLMLASVSFDGLHETFRWVAAIGLNPLDYPGRSAVQGVNTVGLLALWGLMAAVVLGALRVALALGGAGARFRGLVGPWTLALLMIAAAFHIAHYLTALLTLGQYLIAALSDPLERGADYLGLGENWVAFGFLTRTGPVWAIWICQCLLILAAHVGAVLLAQAIARREGLRLTVLAELPLTALMVLYTVFGLWLLAAPAIG